MSKKEKTFSRRQILGMAVGVGGAYPAPVAGMRAPHVHFNVEAKYDRLVTQMFFPNEPLNEQDRFLQFSKEPQRKAVTARLAPPTYGIEADALSFIWDIVLLSG